MMLDLPNKLRLLPACYVKRYWTGYLCIMKRKSIITSLLLTATMAHATAQSTCTFHTVTPTSTNYLVEEALGDRQEPMNTVAETEEQHPYSDLSVEEIERLIAYYENRKSARDSVPNHKPNVCSYADWAPRELTLENLKDVLGEVGLSNKLFVLAQAVLETGNFSSHVCKEYNNLFGLYDSKRRDYYRFASWEDSVVGYKRMIQYRYRGGNYLQFLKRIGYAEDPRYVSKVAQIAKRLYRNLFSN